jgi:hypothetical protein
MSGFELDDVVRLTSLRLVVAGVVRPDENKDKEKEEQKLKIQLLFCGRRIERKGTYIIDSSELQNLRALVGDSVLIKFKVPEEVWKKCLSLGIRPNSECEWDAIPQVWTYFDKVNQKPKFGIWYKPAALLKLDGRQVDYHILEASSRKVILSDAFQFFDEGSGESSFNWQSSLAGMEHQINSELQEAQG